MAGVQIHCVHYQTFPVFEVAAVVALKIGNGAEEDRALNIQVDLPPKLDTAAVSALFAAYIVVGDDLLDHMCFHCCTYKVEHTEDAVFVVFVAVALAEIAKVEDIEDKDIGAALAAIAVVALDVMTLVADMAYCDSDMEDSVLVAVEVAFENWDRIAVMLQTDLD